MPKDQQMLIISVTHKVLDHLKSKKAEYGDMHHLPMIVESSDFIQTAGKLIATLPIESLDEINQNDQKTRELAKSIGRVITSTTTKEAALENFQNLDKSKFVKDTTDWAKEIILCLNDNRILLKLNNSLKPNQHFAAILATKVLDDKSIDNKKITAIAAGMIAGVTAERPSFLGIWEANLFSRDLKSNKPAISKIVGSIFDVAVQLAAMNKFKTCSLEQAMLIGKEIGVKADGNVSQLLELGNTIQIPSISEAKDIISDDDIEPEYVFLDYKKNAKQSENKEIESKSKLLRMT